MSKNLLPVLFLFLFLLSNQSVIAQTPEYQLNGGAICKDGTLEVPVVARNFEEMISLQFSIHWDPTLLTLESVSDLNTELDSAIYNMNMISSGRMAFSWLDYSAQSVSLPDESTIFVLTFKAVSAGAAMASVYFANDPSIVESVKKVNGLLEQVSSEVMDTDIMIYHPTLASAATIEPEMNGMDGSIDISVEGGLAPYTFTWSNGATTEDIENLSSGTYSCEIMDASGCTNDLGPFEVEEITSLYGIESLSTIQLSPNPAREMATLQLQFNSFQNGTIRLFDALGKNWLERNISGADIQVELDLQAIPQGIYFLNIGVEKEQQVQKLIIQ